VALGLLVLALGLVWLVIVGPIVGGFSVREVERRQLVATLQRDQRVMDSVPVWRAAAVAQAQTAGRFAIAAPSEQAAVDMLKERVQKIAADQGYALTAMQDLQADAPPGKVRIRADMELTLTQLYETLRRLEAEGTYVVVDFLSINADRALVTGRSAPLGVRIELTADHAPGKDKPS
jgi:hypothetical protein